MTEIDVNILSSNSINKAIKQVKKEKNDWQKFMDKFIEVLEQKGVEIAKGFAPAVLGGTGEISGYVDLPKHSAYIVASGEYRFIEFGTGTMGAENPHPSQEWLDRLKVVVSNYNEGYNTGKCIIHSEYGYYWFYRGEITTGIPSDPFLYDTVTWLKMNYDKIASEVKKNG